MLYKDYTIEELTKELEELESDYKSRKSMLESFHKGGVITEIEYRNLPEEYEDLIEVQMGAEAVKKMLDEVDLDKLIEELHKEEEEAKGQKEKKIQKRGVRAVHGVRHRRLDRAEITRAKIGGDAQPVMRLKRVAHRLALCRRAVHARALQHSGGRHGHAHGDACENHKHHQQFHKRHAGF